MLAEGSISGDDMVLKSFMHDERDWHQCTSQYLNTNGHNNLKNKSERKAVLSFTDVYLKLS